MMADVPVYILVRLMATYRIKSQPKSMATAKQTWKLPSDWRAEKGCFIHFTTAYLEPDPLVDFY
jgi:hypothetical protein